MTPDEAKRVALLRHLAQEVTNYVLNRCLKAVVESSDREDAMARILAIKAEEIEVRPDGPAAMN